METETNLPEDASATGNGLSESIGKVCTEKEQIEHQSETQSMEKEIIKHTSSEETMTMERSTKLSYDKEELEKIPELHSDENSNIKGVGNIMPEEAKYIKEATDSELERVHDVLPNVESAQVETDGKSIHKEINEDNEHTVEDTNEKQVPDKDHEENTRVLQALDLQEATVNTSVENEKKSQPHYQEQKQETADLKHLNLVLDTAKVYPSNDSGEVEKVPAPHTQEKLEITDIQIPKTALESEPKDEATPILPKLVELDQGEMADKSFEREKEEESTETDNGQGYRPGKELEQMFNAVEEIDLSQTVGKDSTENDHIDQQSETPGIRNDFTEHSNSEGMLIVESSTKSGYDVEELEKSAESHSVDNSETTYGGQLMPEKSISIEEAPEVKLQKSETESVLVDKAPTVSVGVETVEQSIQVKIHNEVEHEVTNTKEEQRSENDFEEKKNDPEACDLDEATRETCVENGKKDEMKTEVKNLETIVINHLDLESETIEVNMSDDTEEHENVPVSPTEEELDIKEGRKWIQEEEKDIEEAIEDDALSTLPTLANVQGETIEEIFQKENLKEEESAAVDKGNTSKSEYELEQTANILEVTTESSEKSTYDVDVQDKIPESHSVNNLEVEDGSKITAEEATDIEQATDLEIQKSQIESAPEDVALSTLHTTASVEVDRDEDSIHEEIHTKEEILENDAGSKLLLPEIVVGETVKEILQKPLQEEESAAIDNDKSCGGEKELEKMLNVVVEAVDQPKTMAKVSAENGEHADHQSVDSNMEITIMNMKLTNEEGGATSASSSKSSYDTSKLEKIPASHSVADSDMKDGSKIMPEEQTGIKECTDVELGKPETESIPEDEAHSELPKLAIVKGETEESLQPIMLQEEESVVAHDNKSSSPENELGKMTNMTEPIVQPETIEKASEENENADHLSKASNMESVVTEKINAEGQNTLESSSKSSVDVDEKDQSKITQEEDGDIKRSADREFETESELEDKSKPSLPNTASFGVEAVETCIQQELHMEVGDIKEGHIPENVFEDKKKVYEVFGLHEVAHQTSAENESRCKAQNQDDTFTKHPTLEGKTTDTIKVPVSQPAEKRETGEDGEFKQEQEEAKEKDEATELQLQQTAKESMPADETLQTLPSTASVADEADERNIEEERSIEDEIQAEEELAVINNTERQIQEIDLEEKEKVHEAFGLHKATHQTSENIELQAEPQSEAQNHETTFIEHLNLEGKTASIVNPTNNKEEQEMVRVSQDGEKLLLEDDEELKQEEVKEMEEETTMQILKTASESVPKDKALRTLPSTETVGEEAVETGIQEEIHANAELAVMSNNEGKIREIDFKEEKKAPKEFGLHEVTHQTTEENELKAEPKSETQNQEATFITHSNLSGKNTDIVHSNNTEEYEKVPISQNGEKLEAEAEGIFKQEEVKEMEEAADIQILKTASEGIPEDKSKQTLPRRASIGLEAVETSNQEEMHAEVELAVTDTEERQIPETDFEEKNEVSEAFSLHEVTHQASAENEQKVEPKFDSLNRESTSIQHLKSEEKNTDIIRPTNVYEEIDNVQVSQIGDKLEIKDDGNLIQREAKEMEEAIEMQSPKTASERVPEDNNTASAGVGATEESIQEENHPEAELAVTNTKVEQKPEIDFVEEKQVPEAFGLHEVTQQTDAENELKLEPQSQAHNKMATIITDIVNPTSDNEEQENVPESHSGGKLEIGDDGKSIQEEAKLMEEANELQLSITTLEGVPEDKAQKSLPSTTSLHVEAIVTSIQEVPEEAELEVTNTKQGHIPEMDFEKKKLPEAFGLQEVTLQDSVENELNAENHLEEQNQAITFIKHPNLEGKLAEINPTNDTGEQEQVSASQSIEKLEVEDEGQFIQEEAEEIEEATEMQSLKTATKSVPEDNSQSSLPNTTYVYVEADEASIQQETHMEEELAVANSKEAQIPENDLYEEEKIAEAFGLHEVTHKTSVGNELKAEPQSEEPIQETIFIKQSKLDENTVGTINPTVDIEEQEKVPVSHSGEKLESVKDEKSLQGEAGVIEEATEMKLLETENEEILQQQTLQRDTSAAIDCDKGYSLENELGKTADVVQATDSPQTMANVSAENEEQANHQPEASGAQSMIRKDINAEGKVTSESSTILSHDADRVEKIAESHSVENSKINYGRKIISEEETNKKESVIGGELDRVQPLPNTFGSVGALDRNIQEEVPTEGELAVTNTKEELTQKTSTENEHKAEPQSEVQIHEITVTEHLNLEGETTEINPANEIKEHEMIPASPTRQKLDITDDGRFIPEGQIKIQLLKTSTESVTEDENQSTFPKSTIVNIENNEKDEELFQEQTLKEEESAALHDNNRFQPENEFEQTVAIEEMDHPETMAKISTENEEHAEQQSEQSSMKNVSTEHNNSEGLVKKSSYDLEEIEKVPELDTVDKLETTDGGKMLEEATDIREATDVELQKHEIESVPEDKAILPHSTIKSNGLEAAGDECIQEEIKKDADSALIDNEEGQRPSNDYVESTKVLEAFDLQKAISNTYLENETKAEPHSNVQIVDITDIKHSNIGGLETAETSLVLDIEELENILVSHTREKSEIKQEEAEEEEEKETEMQSLKTATESAHDDEALSMLPTSETVNGEMVEQSIQEQTFKEKESTAIDNEKSSRPENDHEQTTIILEANVQPVTADKVREEKDENADDKSEAPKMENIITKKINSEGMVVTESCGKTSDDEDEWEKIPESYLVHNSEIKDPGKITPKEEMNIKARALDLQKSETESMPEDKVFSTLSTIEPVRDDIFQKSIQEEEIHNKAESPVTDTKEGRRPENELEEDKKELEAFDLHEETGYTYVENEKEDGAQSLEAMVINDPNLEGMETEETSPINDTKVLEKEQKVVIPGGVSELLSVHITEECSSEARRCTGTSTEMNSEATEGQENSESTFEDSLTGVAIERGTTELETGDLSHEEETTDDTPTEKIVKAADTNKDLKLAPDSITKEPSSKYNCYETMYKEDGTSADDEKGEKVGDNFESNITEKVGEKLDPDGQSDMHESTKKEKRELPAQQIPESPCPCKKLESLFDSEAHNQTNEKLYQTKEKNNNILDQISKYDDHIQGNQYQSENQIKPEPHMEGKHHFSIPLNAKPISIASIISEVHDGVDSTDGSETIQKHTMDSGKILSKAQTSFPREEKVEQVKDQDINNFKAAESNEPRVITDLSLEIDDIQQEATPRDSTETIEQEATAKQETQEAEITQEGNAKGEGGGGGDELENAAIKSSRDADTKASPKKSHGILSGVGSKVKQSISKVKKAITGKSSHPKAQSPK